MFIRETFSSPYSGIAGSVPFGSRLMQLSALVGLIGLDLLLKPAAGYVTQRIREVYTPEKERWVLNEMPSECTANDDPLPEEIRNPIEGPLEVPITKRTVPRPLTRSPSYCKFLPPFERSQVRECSCNYYELQPKIYFFENEEILRGCRFADLFHCEKWVKEDWGALGGCEPETAPSFFWDRIFLHTFCAKPKIDTCLIDENAQKTYEHAKANPFEGERKPVADEPVYAFISEKLKRPVDYTMSPEEILGVGQESTKGEILSAWRRLSLELHPDKNPNDRELAQKAFQIITDAKDEALQSD